ncbi:MAG: hypothetical protein Q8S09_05880 [Hyphomonas sp.]|jgi:hypothetical protein|nr:hypothetical protein [Hyphomonas sp.]MDP3458787.1 hypothetical protein [Hyphomonas sp.]
MGKQEMMELWLNSWRAYTTMTAASLDTLLTMQKSLMNLSSITLSDGFDGTDENYMREAFQRAADANVRRWSDTAGMLKGMPSWMQTMNAMPGTALTNLFDKAQRGRG